MRKPCRNTLVSVRSRYLCYVSYYMYAHVVGRYEYEYVLLVNSVALVNRTAVTCYVKTPKTDLKHVCPSRGHTPRRARAIEVRTSIKHRLQLPYSYARVLVYIPGTYILRMIRVSRKIIDLAQLRCIFHFSLIEKKNRRRCTIRTRFECTYM